jgi:hypothetical protein
MSTLNSVTRHLPNSSSSLRRLVGRHPLVALGRDHFQNVAQERQSCFSPGRSSELT